MFVHISSALGQQAGLELSVFAFFLLYCSYKVTDQSLDEKLVGIEPSP